jgi:hypothetical protein
MNHVTAKYQRMNYLTRIIFTAEEINRHSRRAACLRSMCSWPLLPAITDVLKFPRRFTIIIYANGSRECFKTVTEKAFEITFNSKLSIVC